MRQRCRGARDSRDLGVRWNDAEVNRMELDSGDQFICVPVPRSLGFLETETENDEQAHFPTQMTSL